VPAVTSPRNPTRRPAGRAREGGSVSIQMVVLMPALFSVMFLGMQAALMYHARTVAIAAAQEGARTAAALNSSYALGQQAARTFVVNAGGDGVLKAASVTGSRGPATANVSVSGVSLSVIPGWQPRISQSASAPVERLTG
jgi:Flp pilus assembly protein TadG